VRQPKTLEPLDTTANDHLEDVASQSKSPLIRTRRADIPRLREGTRGRIALILIGLLAAVVVAALGLIYLRAMGYNVATAEVKEVLTTLLPPIVALVGSATGFYFGGHED